MGYTVGIAACLAAFYFTPASWPAVQWVTVFLIGFFLYGPQMLIGLCGAELVRSCPSCFQSDSMRPDCINDGREKAGLMLCNPQGSVRGCS